MSAICRDPGEALETQVHTKTLQTTVPQANDRTVFTSVTLDGRMPYCNKLNKII